METFRIILGVLGVIILASFIPATAYSFFTSRLIKKESEFKEMLHQLGYSDGKGPAYLPSLQSEYEHRDYYLPVGFATIITIICAITLNFGTQMFHHPELNLILHGPSIAFIEDLQPGEKDSLFTVMIIAFAFTGSYIWSIQYLFRRLATVDLTPGAYYGVGVRIIFSIFVALMLYYFLTGGNISNTIDPSSNSSTASVFASPSMLALYAFVAGMFPQRALQYLKDKITFTRTNSKLKADSLPLEMIEGIGLFERTRFLEVGIDNAQNLAQSNFIEMIIRTPFNPREIIDWIGQARLYLAFKGDIQLLRSVGIRTIFDLKVIAGTDCEENLQRIAKLSNGIPLEKLQIICKIIEQDDDIVELQRALTKLVICKEMQAQNTETSSVFSDTAAST